MKEPKERPPLRVIEGGRVHVIDLKVTVDELRDIRELVREHLDLVRDRAERAEKRAEEALIAEQIAREELALLRGELDARRQWSVWRWLLWAMRGC